MHTSARLLSVAFADAELSVAFNLPSTMGKGLENKPDEYGENDRLQSKTKARIEQSKKHDEG